MRPLFPLMTLSFWALGTAAFGTLLAMGLVVAYSDTLMVPWALIGGGLGGLGLAFWALGWEMAPSGQTFFRIFSLVTLGLLIAIRLLLPLFPAGAALALLGVMEAYGALVIGRLRGVIEEFVTEQEKMRVITPIRLSAMGGALVGSALGIVCAAALSEASLIWILGLALLVGWGLTYWCGFVGRGNREIRQVPSVPISGGLKKEWGGWVRLVEGSPFLIWLVALVGGAYLLRGALVSETLNAYSQLLTGPAESLILFFALLLTGSGVILALSYLIFTPIRRRIGALSANLTYPVLLLGCLIVWSALPRGFLGPLLGSVSYLALMPALFLREAQTNLSLFPGRFSRTLGHLLFGVTPLAGMVAAGILWLLANFLLASENRLLLLLFGAVGLIGCAVGVGLYYKRAFFRSLPTSPIQSGPLASSDLPRLSHRQIREALGRADPLFHELALRSAARSKDRTLLPDVARLLAGSPGPKVRMAAYAYIAETEAAPEALLQSTEERVVTRTCAALLLHRIGIDRQTLGKLLGDERGAIRVMGCAIGWQQGLGEAATHVWEGIDLNAVPAAVLTELIEVVQKGSSDPLIRVVKQLAWYPSPAVRREAVRKLGEILPGGSEDPNLLEVALAGLASEDPATRQRALPLLIASGADNAHVHAASHLTDPDPAVRHSAAHTVASAGGWELALPLLASKNPDEVETAIRVLAWSGKEGEEALLRFLHSLPPPVLAFRRFPKTVPVNVAIENGRQKAIRWTAVALESLREGEAAELLRMGTLEPLYRLVPRSYLDPIAPLLQRTERERRSDEAVLRDLKTLAESPDPYIKLGAKIALDPSYKEHEMNRLLFLKGLPYFQDLLLEELALLDAKLEQREFLKGEVIFEEGSHGDAFYLVYQGSISLSHGKQVLTELTVGEAFGEMALFEEESRSATATAASDAVLLALDKSHFHTLIQQRPAILLQICRQLSQRLREMDRRFSLISG